MLTFHFVDNLDGLYIFCGIVCWINTFYEGCNFECYGHKVKLNRSYLQVMIFYGHEEGKKCSETELEWEKCSMKEYPNFTCHQF